MITSFFLHFCSCLFITIGKLSTYKDNWLREYKIENSSNSEVYLSAIYYCIVVLTTVGYGDIISVNTIERLFSIIWMLIGIGFYSYLISTIT